MRETYEFRIVEEFAHRLFDFDEGEKLSSGLIRLIRLSSADPRLQRIGDLQVEIARETGRAFFHGWSIERKYSLREMELADLFHLRISAVFEPAGEECGTQYDESSGCPKCGAGAKQVGPLILDVRRIPKGKDIAKTLAGEIVVSGRFKAILSEAKGFEFAPVRMAAASSAESRDWFQLNVQLRSAQIVAPTRVGIDPFDDDPEGNCRCAAGDLLGLNLLSEVTIRDKKSGGSDIISSTQFIGARRGLLRPERLVLISPKIWKIIKSEKIKGCVIEVAHIETPGAEVTRQLKGTGQKPS